MIVQATTFNQFKIVKLTEDGFSHFWIQWICLKMLPNSVQKFYIGYKRGAMFEDSDQIHK